MSTRDTGQIGVTQILTRRQMRLRTAAAALVLLGVPVALWIGTGIASLIVNKTLAWPDVDTRPLRTGTGPLLNLRADKGSNAGWQIPLTVTLPVDIRWAAAAGIVPFVLWVRLTSRSLLSRETTARHQGLASERSVRNAYGARAARRSGRQTLPTTGFLSRFFLATSASGMYIGRATTPRRGGPLWINFQHRVRIIARPGWGKSLRLLVPIIRSLTGPAVVSSIEAEIFMATVKARELRRPPARFPLLAHLPRLRRRSPFTPPRFRWMAPLPVLRMPQPRHYPVYVVDCSSPETRFAAGYPTVRWNPIPGCETFTVATQRAAALVKGVDAESGQSSDTASFFQTSATQVLAAWLHAASFRDHIEIDDIVEWLRDNNITTPESILAEHVGQADPAARMNLLKHLDPKGERTTSGVERYLTMALSSLASGEGRKVCGRRSDPQFDMHDLIEREGTVYLLAEPAQMEVARPLLSLFATEMFIAAERVARQQPGKKKRLPRPFMGILDELRFGVRVANLPYVANALRKFGIGYVYACTNAGDEEELYGPSGAQLLRSVAGTSIYGGIDPASAQDVSERAGSTTVVTATRGTDGHYSESITLHDTFTVADQQKLKDGESVIIGQGLQPFLAYTPATFEQRGSRRRIDREIGEVNDYVVRSRLEQAQIDEAAATAGSFDYPLTTT